MDAGIEIGGERYEVPTLDSLDMDEAQIMFDLSGVVIEDFAPAHPDSDAEEKLSVQRGQLQRVRNPSFKRALVHIAYRRKHPDLDYFAISDVIGKANALDVSLEVLRGDDSEDPSQGSPKPHEPRSDTNETSGLSSSGKPSGSDTDRPALSLAPTGTSPLGTYYQPSPPTPVSSAS